MLITTHTQNVTTYNAMGFIEGEIEPGNNMRTAICDGKGIGRTMILIYFMYIDFGERRGRIKRFILQFIYHKYVRSL